MYALRKGHFFHLGKTRWMLFFFNSMNTITFPFLDIYLLRFVAAKYLLAILKSFHCLLIVALRLLTEQNKCTQ